MKSQRLTRVVLAILYSVICAVLGLAEINPEGTGSGIFVMPALTWPLVIVAMVVLGRLSTLQNRIIFVLVLIAHYFIVASSVWRTFADERWLRQLRHSWYVNGEWIVFTSVVYVVGQIVMWVMFFKSVRTDSNN